MRSHALRVPLARNVCYHRLTWGQEDGTLVPWPSPHDSSSTVFMIQAGALEATVMVPWARGPAYLGFEGAGAISRDLSSKRNEGCCLRLPCACRSRETKLMQTSRPGFFAYSPGSDFS